MRVTSLVSHVTSRLDLAHCLTAYRLRVTVTPLGLGLVQVLIENRFTPFPNRNTEADATQGKDLILLERMKEEII